MGIPANYAVMYAASVVPLEDERLYAKAYSIASPYRKRKTDGCRFTADRRLSLCAELLLRHALFAAGLGHLPLEFTFGMGGKPYLKQGDVFFNLSHRGQYVLCAISDCEVGCDVERIAPIDLAVARRFFTDAEYADIMAQPGREESIRRFYRYWTLKESFIKATGKGKELPLDGFRIICGEEVSVIQHMDEKRYRFFEFMDIPGYQCALCTAGEQDEANLFSVDLGEMLREGWPEGRRK